MDEDLLVTIKNIFSFVCVFFLFCELSSFFRRTAPCYEIIGITGLLYICACGGQMEIVLCATEWNDFFLISLGCLHIILVTRRLYFQFFSFNLLKRWFNHLIFMGALGQLNEKSQEENLKRNFTFILLVNDKLFYACSRESEINKNVQLKTSRFKCSLVKNKIVFSLFFFFFTNIWHFSIFLTLFFVLIIIIIGMYLLR